MNLPIKIRELTQEDRSWIIDSWSKSQIRDMEMRLEKDHENFKGQYNPRFYLNGDLFWDAHISLSKDRLLKCNILVACNPEDEEQTFGYIVFKDNMLYWIYTKYMFRNEKIGTRLMSEAFPEFKEKPIKIFTVTYSISHLKDKWNLERS